MTIDSQIYVFANFKTSRYKQNNLSHGNITYGPIRHGGQSRGKHTQFVSLQSDAIII